MNTNHQQIWNSCLGVIRENVSESSFKTWFNPIVPLRLRENILTIQVPSQFFYEYIEEKYVHLIGRTLRSLIGSDAKLEYSISKNINKENLFKNPTRTQQIQNNPSQDIPNKVVNPFVVPQMKKVSVDSQLNPKNVFENFVEGECNRLARSAGFAVACNPGGTAFNPLFLYGDSGLGKTHLAQAIGHEAKLRFSEKAILYVSAGRFQSQYQEAVRTNNVNDFLHFYQMIDILIIDDIQELAGKEGTQTTFFHIFNHLHQSGKQLILTSDKPPIALKGLNARLLSRFKWGLSADIEIPSFETRMEILRLKAQKEGLQVTNDILEYIAGKVINNVRELEGALVSLLAQSTLNEKELSLDLTATVVEKLVTNTKREMSVDFIQKVICEHFNMPVSSLQAKTRKREIVQARQLAMYFAKNLTTFSLASIGAQIGNKDHATVLHACKTVTNLLETDKDFKLQFGEIDKKLRM